MHEKKDTTRYQKKIKTQLRLFTWLFLLFYICYAVLQVMLLKELFPIRFQEPQKRYMIRLLMEGILWLFIVRSLQKGRKIARLQFTLCAILSLYFLSALPAFYQLSLSGWEATTLRILFTLLMISKYLITFCCVCYLYRDPHIVSIWKKADRRMAITQPEEEEERQEDEVLNQVLQEVSLVHMEEDNRLFIRAQHFLHRYTFYLVMILLGTLIGFLLFLFIMQLSFPTDIDGLQYVQRFFLLAILFTSLLWSFAGVAMFMYSSSCRILIMLAWLCESIHLLQELPQVWQTFQSQQYQLPSILCIIVLELLRYGLLLKLTIALYQNPFLQLYWKRKTAIKKAQRNKDSRYS